MALLPASAAPTTAPVAAPATAPVNTSRTAFVALLKIPGAELAFRDLLPPVFLLEADEADFFAVDRFFVVLPPVDRFFVLFVVAIQFLLDLSTNLNDFRSVGPSARG